MLDPSGGLAGGARRADEGDGRRLIAWVAIVGLLLYLAVLGGGSSRGVFVVEARILSLAFGAGALTIWLAVAWRHPFWRPRTSLALPAAVLIVAFAIATVMSWNVRLSAEYLGYAVLLLALYLLLQRLLVHPFFSARLLALSGLLSGAICLMYLGAVAAHWATWWGLLGRLAVPPLRPAFESLAFANPGGVAAMAVLLAVPAWAAGGETRLRRLALGLLAVLAAAVVLISSARGAWFGLAVAFLVTLGLALVSRSGGDVKRAVMRVPRSAIVLVALGGLGVVSVLGPGLLARLTAGGGQELRSLLLAVSVRMFETDPLTGSGPGTWVARRTALTGEDEIDYYIPHAHNVVAQGLAEFGVVGLVAGAFALLGVAALIWNGLRSSDRRARRFALASAFSLSYALSHQLVDMYMHEPAFLLAVVLPIAALDATMLGGVTHRQTAARRLPAKASTVLLAGSCLVAMLGLFRIELAAIDASRAVRLADQDLWADAGRSISDAATADPQLPAYWYLTALAEGRMDPIRSLATMERYARVDSLPQGWLNVAKLRLDAGQPTAATEALDEAMRLGQQQAAIALPAGVLYLELGDEAAAGEAFRRTLILAPGLTDDPFWRSTPALSSAGTDAIDSAIAMEPSATVVQVAILAGRADEAGRIVAGMSPYDRVTYGLVIEAWGGDQDSVRGLYARAAADPTGVAVPWAARVAERFGDLDRRDKFRRMAVVTGTSPDADTGLDVVVATSPDQTLRPPGPGAGVHGFWAYRRPFPAAMLVPGLPRVVSQ